MLNNTRHYCVNATITYLHNRHRATTTYTVVVLDWDILTVIQSSVRQSQDHIPNIKWY